MLNRLYVILSAELKGQHAEVNEVRSDQLYAFLERRFTGMYDKVQGHYRGTSEVAYIVQCKDHKEVGDLFDEAREHDQESIMLIDPKGQGFLLFDNLKMERLGPVTASEWVPDGLLSYTYNPVSNTYYYVL